MEAGDNGKGPLWGLFLGLSGKEVHVFAVVYP